MIDSASKIKERRDSTKTGELGHGKFNRCHMRTHECKSDSTFCVLIYVTDLYLIRYTLYMYLDTLLT